MHTHIHTGLRRSRHRREWMRQFGREIERLGFRLRVLNTHDWDEAERFYLSGASPEYAALIMHQRAA